MSCDRHDPPVYPCSVDSRTPTVVPSLRPYYVDSGYLQADELGRPYHPATISNWFGAAIKAVGAGGFSCTTRGTLRPA